MFLLVSAARAVRVWLTHLAAEDGPTWLESARCKRQSAAPPVLLVSRRRRPLSPLRRISISTLAARESFSSEREYRIRDRRCDGRDARLADTAWGSIALHEIERRTPGSLIDPDDASAAAEVVLLNSAALHRDPAIQRETHPEDHRAFELGAHTVAVDDRARVKRHPHFVYPERPIRALRHRRNDSRVAEEAPVRREAEGAPVLPALAPPGGACDALDDVAQPAGIDRVLVERLAIIGQFRDAEI
jgi:hypothetical protein